MTERERERAGRRHQNLSPEEKLRLVQQAGQLDGTELGALLRREGVHETDLAEWRTQAQSCKLGHRRASKVRVVIARVRYKAVDAEGNTDVIPTPMPAEILPGSIAAPSLVAHVIMENIGQGMPLFRLEDALTRDSVHIDRGTLSRWKKAVGDRLADTLVKAMHTHALATAFCIATDATGVNVQPIYKGVNPARRATSWSCSPIMTTSSTTTSSVRPATRSTGAFVASVGTSSRCQERVQPVVRRR
jgi:transposase-like protein